jgi:hypothetical protein
MAGQIFVESPYFRGFSFHWGMMNFNLPLPINFVIA